MSTRGHHLSNLGCTLVSDAICQVLTISSKEVGFFKCFTMYGHGGHLVMWPRSFDQIFVSPSKGGSMWNLILIGPVVSEKMFGRRWRRRTAEACLSYKLIDEPLGWAKNGMCITTSIFHIMYQGEWGTFYTMNKEKTKSTALKQEIV